MREILFRGKRLDNGEWMEGCLWLYIGVPKILTPANNVGYDVDPATVSQYTGVLDKNGKKIFEGDIIHLDYIGKTRGVEGIATVIFENGKFGVKWGWHKEFVCLDGFANTTLEIVGNIHDNTQLSERGVENAPDVR